ncbi:hypothetical protein IEQ34_021671 [Dendrobium chrysotoxum]|uniref:Piwi domain-containing protein n=1 Tax=Dendrobium chrysotoxum TaxID=161865 RepID=A0AAV7G5S7_DENCH|nr:hypothetical protein IEQ34_021671 [Dendrobium chrysotoxum]
MASTPSQASIRITRGRAEEAFESVAKETPELNHIPSSLFKHPIQISPYPSPIFEDLHTPNTSHVDAPTRPFPSFAPIKAEPLYTRTNLPSLLPSIRSPLKPTPPHNQPKPTFLTSAEPDVQKMVNGGRVRSWSCINFDRNIQDNVVRRFCEELAVMCRTSGMEFAPEPILPLMFARPDQVEGALTARHHDAMSIMHKELDLLIAILPDINGSLYGNLKRICETELGLVSQCCLAKHVCKLNKQYLANVALKINVKVGGRNTVLVDAISRRIPLVSDKPTIIFGADVTHPHPGENSRPSIAAVVASQDWPEITKYAWLVSAQARHQELIQDLFKIEQDPRRGSIPGGMIRELLLSFKRATGFKPERIIFYRDGVSEGQFYQVLLYELDAIRKACVSLESDYLPPVTFVVVQKRHHTRLFANNHNDQRSVDRSGNILPGTVVDSKICHPTEFDFYLCSHAGIQGTSRPSHYHVLWDENKFSADALQTLTNILCYTYARCTRSVSIVPPVYYAHLAAFRARFYMETETSDSGSMASAAAGQAAAASGSRSDRAPGSSAVRPLPALKDNIKQGMVYC